LPVSLCVFHAPLTRYSDMAALCTTGVATQHHLGSSAPSPGNQWFQRSESLYTHVPHPLPDLPFDIYLMPDSGDRGALART
jgi:hypothetical protein